MNGQSQKTGWLAGATVMLALFAACASGETSVQAQDAYPGETSSRADFRANAGLAPAARFRLERIRRATAYARFDQNPLALRNLQAELERFSAALPYSAKTRAAQRRVGELQVQLQRAKDPERSETIVAELRSLEEQMESDPGYAATMAALARELAPADPLNPQHPGAEQRGERQPLAASYGSLTRGDVMLVRNGGSFAKYVYAMTYTHAGTYDGNGQVYESNGDGVRLRPLSNWQQGGLYVALGRDNKRSVGDVQNALNWAKGRYGSDGRTPYNYFFPDKWTDSRLYCSQLVWKIHSRLGVDLDSNAWTYLAWLAAKWGLGASVAIPAVAPDEVALSGNLTVYSAGWN